MKNPFNKEQDEYWISISDLMSGLMMVFLFISISYMVVAMNLADKERMEKEDAELALDKVDRIAESYYLLQEQLYQELLNEFKNDLEKWSASIDRDTISVRFREPEILFDQGKSDLKDKFTEILNDFFPRYVRIISQPEFKEDIVEVRIEGHTSSEWEAVDDPLESYIRNMELSQDRTRSVLQYVLGLTRIANDREWLRSVLTANGLSSSKLIVREGQEDKELSRRVEFRIRTNAEERIGEILEGENRGQDN